MVTNRNERWSGSQDPASGAVLSLAQDFSSSWGWSANAGARISSGYVVRNAQSGSGYMGGVEIHHSINPGMVVGFEAMQSTAGFYKFPLNSGLACDNPLSVLSRFSLLASPKALRMALEVQPFGWVGLSIPARDH